MKRYIALVTALLVSAALLSGCARNNNGQSDETTVSTELTTTAAPLEPLKGGKFTVPEIETEQYEIPDNEAIAFVTDMRLGWNLGNTFDATDDSGNLADDMTLETAWIGGIKTSKALIDNVKNAGFNTVRLPVSWHNHVDENYTIKPEYLDRIQEVVDYVIDNDMYCILNIHHDTELNYCYPDTEHLDNSVKYISTIWKQLAERFADYDNKLVFESINEPRLKGTNLEWNFNDTNEKSVDAANCINTFNQTFVDTVRACGGNNSERYLLMPGYAASYNGALTDVFKLPEDTAENRLIVSVHAYVPYNFALQLPSGKDSFDINDATSTNEINSFMDRLYDKFVSKGTPVLIGEFAAVNRSENTQARTDFAAYYVASARARGITCCWWDNNAFFGSGENLGLLNRIDMKWRYEDLVMGMVKYSQERENAE